MTLAELTEQLAVEPRQIRFLIAEGILPAAQKTGRAADAYDDTHLRQARRYLALHRMGMKPASIRVLMAFDDTAPVFQACGVEVRVAPTADAATIDIDALTAEIRQTLRIYFGKE